MPPRATHCGTGLCSKPNPQESDGRRRGTKQRHPRMVSIMHTTRLWPATALIALTVLQASACASWGNREKGAVVGAAAGAGVGGIIGNQTGSTARGAIIGAVIGGAAGAVIGHQMDQQAKEIDQSVTGATVERVGEGIQVTFESGLLFD